jgi:phage shock protein E
MGARFNQLVAEAKTRIREVAPQEVLQRQQAGAIVIDVREADDFAKEHVRGATHLSRGVLELKIEQQVPDPKTPIICYCGGGSRAALATENLQKMGYTNVVSLAGGFKAWKEQGLPTD